MSLEAWGDGGDDEGGFTDERVAEIGTESFRRGVQMCRRDDGAVRAARR